MDVDTKAGDGDNCDAHAAAAGIGPYCRDEWENESDFGSGITTDRCEWIAKSG